MIDNAQLTIEFEYLLPKLESLQNKTAVDVGSHSGTVTDFLEGLGFRVIALEPNPAFSKGLKIAASDEDGTAILTVGSAAGVSSLEPEWVSLVFPAYFHEPRMIRVQTRRLSTLLPELGARDIGFLKVDAE